jgi:hypothetical protein
MEGPIFLHGQSRQISPTFPVRMQPGGVCPTHERQDCLDARRIEQQLEIACTGAEWKSLEMWQATARFGLAPKT